MRQIFFITSVALCTMGGPAEAAVLTYQATGVVTLIDDAPRPISVFPSVAIGDTFIVQWTFDDATPPCMTAATSYRYCSVSPITVSVGSTTRSFSIPADRADFGYQHITFGPSLSGWTWFGSADVGGNFDRFEGTMGLYFGPPASGPLAESGLNIPSPAQLPMTPFDGQGRLHYQHASTTQFTFDETDDFYGTINFVSAVVVPIPAAVWLLASALGGLAVARRRLIS